MIVVWESNRRLQPGTPRPAKHWNKWLAINWMIFTQSLHRKWLGITKHLCINGWKWGSRNVWNAIRLSISITTFSLLVLPAKCENEYCCPSIFKLFPAATYIYTYKYICVYSISTDIYCLISITIPWVYSPPSSSSITFLGSAIPT